MSKAVMNHHKPKTDVAVQWLQSYLVGHSTYDVEMPSQPSSRLCVAYHRGQSWAPYCSLCTLQTWSQWLKAMSCHHTCMPTIRRLFQSTPSRRRSPSVWAMSPAGWSITDCHWIATRKKSYGERQVDDNTSCRVQLCQLTALWLSPWCPLAIWASI